jgi:hypothetical protein
LSKRSLMLSTAAIALLGGAALADTTIDTAKTDPYTTGALLTGNTGTANAGKITITSAGSVDIAKAGQGAITINTNDWLLNKGYISNKDNNGAYGIHVDLSADRDFTGLNMGNNSLGTAIATGTGIYFDNTAGVTVSGSNGTGKIGIYLDANGCTTATCAFKGDITLAAGSGIGVTGDGSSAILINQKAVLNGTLTIAGTVSVTSNSMANSATNMYGLQSLGQVQGNISLETGSSLSAFGHGARAMSIQGSGVTGYIAIAGELKTSVNIPQITNANQQVNTTTNPEAGAALEIGANVGHGVAILGPGAGVAAASVSVTGTGPAIYISPLINSSATQTTPLTIGVYDRDTTNGGFSFYNRGSVSITPTNYNDSSTAMRLDGTSPSLQTVLTGGIFNSGVMSASAQSSNSATNTTSFGAIGIYVGSYVDLQENTAAKTASPSITVPGDRAALVNSNATGYGVIQASLNGTKGGVAQAIFISTYSNVPSIINTGLISASATTTDAALSGNAAGSSYPLAAFGIVDGSGSLTSIFNGGCIAAYAGVAAVGPSTCSTTKLTPLNNNTQTATAIYLKTSNPTAASLTGVTIKNYAGSNNATIVGDILFGTGNNQILDLQGTGSTASTVVGNVIYGPVSTGSTSGDRLIIGNNASLTGAVLSQVSTRTAGVQVDVAANGTLYLLNNSDTLRTYGYDCSATPDACTLKSTHFNVAAGGKVYLGVNRSMSESGGVVTAQEINFANDSTLDVQYASFVPPSEHKFVLMTAETGHLNIDPSAFATFSLASNKPYLLQTARMCMTTQTGCDRPAGLPSYLDAVVLDVTPKEAVDPNSFGHNTSHTFQPDTDNYLGLYPGSIAVAPIKTEAGTPTTLFEQANIALGIDDALGSSMIRGIHSKEEAQIAYNSFAPNLTGGTRAIAISITDSATGPVAARQRALRMYGRTEGEMTLWGQEFVQMIKDPGQGEIDPNTGFKTSPGFKDHGFGFVLGIDSGSPKYGWYGGAFTFYAGDVNELSRTSHQNQQWYLLSLYSAWRGKGLFLDTKLDAGYGHIDGKRFISLITPNGTNYREADNKHAGALISGSVATGAIFSYGAATLMPQLNLDGLYLREERYTEHNPVVTTLGDGFDLKVNQAYAKSLRAFIGFDARYDLELWDFFLQPEVRAGYRYDFINDPIKLKAAFAYANTSNPSNPTAGSTFTLTGPDPARGNFVLGGTLAATTGAWSLGLSFDMVRGQGGAVSQVGTVSILGRI